MPPTTTIDSGPRAGDGAAAAAADADARLDARVGLDARIVELADRLWRAERERTPIGPLTETDAGLSVRDAYAIQTHNVHRRIRAGRAVRGRKVGLTSRPMRRPLGVDEPDFGVLLDDMFVEEGDEIELASTVQPRVQAQLAFVLGRDLAGPGVTTGDALTAIAGVLPALEVADSRIADWRGRLADTVADNASGGRLVLGGRITPVAGLDLRLLGMALTRGGELIDTGAGAAALGHPARCVAWLANTLGDLGTALLAGDYVLSGGLHAMVPARPRDVFHAEFAQLGPVTARFSGGVAGGDRDRARRPGRADVHTNGRTRRGRTDPVGPAPEPVVPAEPAGPGSGELHA